MTKKKVKRRRVTVGHHALRRNAEQHRQIQETYYPNHNVVVTGRQGDWKVRRDAYDEAEKPNIVTTTQMDHVTISRNP